MNTESLKRKYANKIEISKEEYESAKNSLPKDDFDDQYSSEILKKPITTTTGMFSAFDFEKVEKFYKLERLPNDDINLVMLEKMNDNLEQLNKITGRIETILIVMIVLNIIGALCLIFARSILF